MKQSNLWVPAHAFGFNAISCTPHNVVNTWNTGSITELDRLSPLNTHTLMYNFHHDNHWTGSERYKAKENKISSLHWDLPHLFVLTSGFAIARLLITLITHLRKLFRRSTWTCGAGHRTCQTGWTGQGTLPIDSVILRAEVEKKIFVVHRLCGKALLVYSNRVKFCLTRRRNSATPLTHPILPTNSFSLWRRRVLSWSLSRTLSTAVVSSPTTSCSTWRTVTWDGSCNSRAAIERSRVVFPTPM